MPEFQLKIRGLKQLDKKLQKLSSLGRLKALENAARKAAKPIRQAMMDRVAVRTGATWLDIDVLVRQTLPDRTIMAIGPTIIGTAWRAHFLEFGTRFQAAQPFMRPALENKAGESLRIFKRELLREIKKRVR